MEKRRERRMDISVNIRLKPIGTNGADEEFVVDVINLSKSGMAFKCDKTLEIGDCYDTQITIWTQERINTLIRIVRCEDNMYGSEFIALDSADAMKIKIYEMLNYPEDEE